MKHIIVLLITSLISIHLFAEGRRVALVIGNANYDKYSQFSPLPTPLNDAKAFAFVLDSLGFEITTGNAVCDMNKDGMLHALEQFEHECEGAEVALFYFSGHGLIYSQNEENLLLPTNEQFTGTIVRERSVAVETIERILLNSKCKTKLIIIDACRSNPYNTNPVKGEKDLKKDPLPGIMVFYATGEGKIATTGNTQYSVFTESWLEVLRGGNAKNKNISDIFYAVKNKTYEKSQAIFETQIPQCKGVIADFYFDPDIELIEYEKIFQNAPNLEQLQYLVERNYEKAYAIYAKRVLKEKYSKESWTEAEKYAKKAIEAYQDIEMAKQVLDALEALGYYSVEHIKPKY